VPRITRLTPGLQPGFKRRQVAYAATELYRDPNGRQDRSNRSRIDRPACEGAVEVDQVQVTKALALEGLGLGRGIIVEHGGRRHVAELQAHALAVFEVDGGKQDHVEVSHMRAAPQPSVCCFHRRSVGDVV
jgi:hypothetical protein